MNWRRRARRAGCGLRRVARLSTRCAAVGSKRGQRDIDGILLAVTTPGLGNRARTHFALARAFSAVGRALVLVEAALLRPGRESRTGSADEFGAEYPSVSGASGLFSSSDKAILVHDEHRVGGSIEQCVEVAIRFPLVPGRISSSIPDCHDLPVDDTAGRDRSHGNAVATAPIRVSRPGGPRTEEARQIVTKDPVVVGPCGRNHRCHGSAETALGGEGERAGPGSGIRRAQTGACRTLLRRCASSTRPLLTMTWHWCCSSARPSHDLATVEVGDEGASSPGRAGGGLHVRQARSARSGASTRESSAESASRKHTFTVVERLSARTA